MDISIQNDDSEDILECPGDGKEDAFREETKVTLDPMNENGTGNREGEDTEDTETGAIAESANPPSANS